MRRGQLLQDIRIGFIMFPTHPEPLTTEILPELSMNALHSNPCASGTVTVIWSRRHRIFAEILVLFNYRIASLEGIIT
jgi:hypothetical protein